MNEGSASAHIALASQDATVTVEVEGQPADSPPAPTPPGLAETGLPLVVLLLVAIVLLAGGMWLRRRADRLAGGDTP